MEIVDRSTAQQKIVNSDLRTLLGQYHDLSKLAIYVLSIR